MYRVLVGHEPSKGGEKGRQEQRLFDAVSYLADRCSLDCPDRSRADRDYAVLKADDQIQKEVCFSVAEKEPKQRRFVAQGGVSKLALLAARKVVETTAFPSTELASPPLLDQLVLLGPNLSRDAFAARFGHRALGYPLKQLFKRIVVLYSPLDAGVFGQLGAEGPGGEMLDGVHAIDVTRYFDHHDNVTDTVSCSLEALGIVERALKGLGESQLDRHPAAKSA